MRILFNEELETKEQLNQFIKNQEIEVPANYRIGVISILEDENGRMLLQRRGPKSRDEQGLLEEIGGGVEETDKTFRDAINREITEEVGTEAKIYIDEFVGGFLETKMDTRKNQVVNWLFLVYKGYYLGGNLQIAEKEKCLGYEFYTYDTLPKKELSASCISLNEYYHHNKTKVK